MSAKDVVIEAVRRLPEDASLDEISEEIAILAAIRRGEAEADAGQLLPHDEVARRPAPWKTSK
jgi:predicted transcriptional regulator